LSSGSSLEGIGLAGRAAMDAAQSSEAQSGSTEGQATYLYIINESVE